MAIAFDAASTGNISSGNASTSFSHTCTGSDLALVIGITAQNDASANRITVVSYNGVAATPGEVFTDNEDNTHYIFYLLGPATGTHDIAVTRSGTSNNAFINAASYTGVQQSSQTDATGEGRSNSTNSRTQNVTTVTDNVWAVMVAYDANGGTITASTNSTQRAAFSTYSKLFDSNAAITPAGSYSMTITRNSSSASPLSTVLVAFKPVSSTAHTKILTDTATATATFSRVWTLARTLTETVTGIASVVKTAARTLVEAAIGADTFTKGIAEAISIRVGASADDGDILSAPPGITITNDESSIEIDEGSSDSVTGFFRFPEIAIPQGSEIASATLTLTASANGFANASQVITINAHDVDDAPQLEPVFEGSFGTYNPPRTSAFVATSASTWIAETEYESADISTVIQEVIDRAGWESGNALQLFAGVSRDGGAAFGRPVYAYDGDPDKAALLSISYIRSGNIFTETYTETATAAASLIKTASRTLSDTASAVATFARTLTTSRTFSEAASAIASIVRTSTRTLTEEITATDAYTYLTVKAATLSETAEGAATFIRSIARQFTEGITASDTFTGLRGLFPTFTETATATASLLKTPSKVLSQAATATDSLLRATGRTLADAVEAADTFTGFRARIATLTDTATATASLIRTATRTLAEGVTTAASFVGAFGRILTESANATDALTTMRLYARTLADSITASDTFARAVTYARTLTETVTASDTIRRLLNGVAVIWSNAVRATATFANKARNVATWTKRDRTDSEWDNRPRNDY